MKSPILDDFLQAVAHQDDSADEKLDRLIASTTPEDLARTAEILLREGGTETFAGALELVNLLADRHVELWDSLVFAVENRPELGMENSLTAVALLRAADRLPQLGACKELAARVEEIEEMGEELDHQIEDLLDSGPDQMLPLLISLEEMTADQRAAAIADLLERGSPQTSRELLEILALPARATGFVMPLAESASVFCISDDETSLSVRSWVTDLSRAGQFGAGLDFMDTGEAVHRFVLAGSWQKGVRLFEYQALAADEPGFEIQLEPPRMVCNHPTLVRKWVMNLLDTGFSADWKSNQGIWTAGYFDRRLLCWKDEDTQTWNQWQVALVDQNPLDLRIEPLLADARRVVEGVSHWFGGDATTHELVEEFQKRNCEFGSETGQSIVRVWFERYLGPQMGDIVARLQAMSFFWLAQSGMDTAEKVNLEELARASARLAQDLADPSRVVPGHPFVQAVAKWVFQNQ